MHINKSWKIVKRSKYLCQDKIMGGCFVFPLETEAFTLATVFATGEKS